jgi:hypothetical protein
MITPTNISEGILSMARISFVLGFILFYYNV